MAYIGRSPVIGRYAKLDDISSSFNGSTTTFNLTSDGGAQTVATEAQLIVSLEDAILEPQTDYTVTGSTITFTTAPGSGNDYFAVLLGNTLNVGVPSDNSLANRHIKSDAAIAMSKLDGSSGTLSALTVDNVIINGTNIGHTSDTDAIAIASNGVVTMNQIPVLSAGLNVSGGTIAGTLSTAAQGNVTSLGTLSALTVSGDISGGTINATGDTAADDNAAIGYTAAEGLILTGQGSTGDITLKNDAGTDVCYVPTGTDDLRFPDNA